MLAALLALAPSSTRALPQGEWVFTGGPTNPSGPLLALADGTAIVFNGLYPAEIYHPDTGSWAQSGSPHVLSQPGTTTLLPSGLILLAGGRDGGGAATNATELFNPASGASTLTGFMHLPRRNHRATLLATGKVLVSGGLDANNQFVGVAEIYDPATGHWSLTGSLNFPRADHAALVLADGNVLVAGGSPSVAETYDVATGVWATSSVMPQPVSPAFGVTLINGHALIVGGNGVTQLYDPIGKGWAPAGTVPSGQSGRLAQLHDGTPILLTTRIFVCGGAHFCPEFRVFLFDVGTNMWVEVTAPVPMSGGGNLVALTDGRVLSPGSPRSQLFRPDNATPRLIASPPTLSFQVSFGSAVQETVIIRNTGGAVLIGTTSGQGPFTILSGASFTLLPGASTSAVVQFAPSSVGQVSGAVLFASNGNWISVPVTGGVGVRLSGRVADAAGAPVASVTMTLQGAASGTTLTDAAGHYEFFVEPNDGYTITPTGPGLTFNPSTRSVIVGTQDVSGLDFTSTTPLAPPPLPTTRIGVLRDGGWYLDLNGNRQWDGCGPDGCIGFGTFADKGAVGDWTGTGRSKLGVFRDGVWALDLDGNGQWNGCGIDGCAFFGAPGDQPVVGDWTGTGVFRIGVFRDGGWYLDFSGNRLWDGCGVDACIGFGQPGDIPVVGDWAGTGTSKLGVFRNGQWYLDFNGNGLWDGCGVDACIGFGQPGDVPVVGDWNGNGRAKVGVFRNGGWYLDVNGNGLWDGCSVDACIPFGAPGDQPVTGNW